MTVQDIITMAKYGELNSIAIAEDNDAIVSFLNLGMIELYKRFVLQTDEVIITLGVATTVDDDYVMVSDTVYEMPTGFMYIVGAYEEDGSTIPVNEEEDLLSINTISWNRIQVPTPTLDANISIIYVSAPDTILVSSLDEQLKLPPQLTEALLHYVGYRGHGSVDGSIDKENNTHYNRFERSCERVKKDGLITSDGLSTLLRFSSKGFA